MSRDKSRSVAPWAPGSSPTGFPARPHRCDAPSGGLAGPEHWPTGGASGPPNPPPMGSRAEAASSLRLTQSPGCRARGEVSSADHGSEGRL